ncbi:MAG: hypothetical protein J6K14_07895 [Clostridia bacterium]|nr:hypothetical protein [Clostridia bacterium]
MNPTFYVRDFAEGEGSDSEAIERCLAAAKAVAGAVTVVLDGKDYYLDRAILIPSDTTVVIDDCTLKQNDFVYDNVFRGDNLLMSGIDPYGTPAEVTPLKNIKILGRGNATVIGTDKPRIGYHPFFKEYQPMTGDFWGFRTLMFSFSNADGVEIAGLKLRQTMCWAICFDACTRCHVHDLDIRSDVKNGDGIDFRSGCHHCTVENITGFTSDDTVACTALSRGKQPRELSRYLGTLEPYNASHENIDGSVHHITIRGIHTGGYHHGVICLAANGNQVHDIEISDVRESAEGKRHATVMVYTGYGSGYRAGDIHDISIRDVTAQTAEYAVLVKCAAENLTTEKITQNNPLGKTYAEE